MNRILVGLALAGVVSLTWHGNAEGRGFGGYRGGSYGGYRSESFGGYRNYGSYSGYHSGGYAGYRGYGAAGGSYDRSWSGSHGGSVNVTGGDGVVRMPGSSMVGGYRNVSATGPGGRTYDGYHQGGAAVGPYGRAVGGSTRYGAASGNLGIYAGAAHTGVARMPTDFGMARYSTFGAAGVNHSTAYWSHNYMTTRAGFIHNNFGYYNCFHPGWYNRYPGAWFAPGWGAERAWQYATWASLANLWAIPAYPIYYDYGNTIVYQNDNVYVNGQDEGTAQNYAQQAITLADQGQQAPAPPQQEWTPLGVFALVQGDDKTSNNIFQLAVDKAGVMRGNYYDGLLDTTTPVFGSVDKKTQRAAWTIGKDNKRVFETGVYNLTKSESPVLVHFGTERTLQMLLVRMEQPKK